MQDKLTRADWNERRNRGWRDRTGAFVEGATYFLTLSGLALFALPHSLVNQHTVVVHTVIGLAYVLPLAVYMTRHVRTYLRFPRTHVTFSGWFALALLVVCVVSGVALTYEAAFGTRISELWRLPHLLTTFGLIVLLGAHIVSAYGRARRADELDETAGVRRAVASHRAVTLGVAFVGVAAVGGLAVAVRPVEFENTFPADYDAAPYEGAGPFSPSLATTESGGALDPRSLAGSSYCGTAGCHEQIYEEWLPSAHRYASMDLGFQKIQSVMAAQNGATSTRYCGGCHDPISLFSGTKNIGVDHLSDLDGYQEGISCLACHAISETDVKGNADYVVTQPERYAWELRDGAVAEFLAKFTLRAYPGPHVATLSRRMFKAPEFCAACHKQFIDEEVNQVGWVQLQNQYDNWKASRWHTAGDPEKTLECRECHMPLHASTDPAAGDEADFNRTRDDGRHRSHRFLGANQFIPVAMDLPGGKEHAALVESWLRGELEIPELEGRWRDGPAVPIEIEAPARVALGEKLDIKVHLVNNKVGHDFPTGPLDIIQAWVELEVVDADGKQVYTSGRVDEQNFVETGSFMFKAEPVDRYGNLIDRHNLWEMVGVRFKRSLFPGSEEVASYSLVCAGADPALADAPILDTAAAVPLTGGLVGPLTIRAKLNYRKFDQYLLDFAFGKDSGATSPITVMSTDEATVALISEGE
jgi:hypothetical protein